MKHKTPIILYVSFFALIAYSAFAQDTTTSTPPDNTANNVRDRSDQTVTPLDQGNNQEDVDTTAQIRKEILANKNITTNGDNVKVITNKGHVTLRGPVNNAGEKIIIGKIAARIANAKNVDNQLEVINPLVKG